MITQKLLTATYYSEEKVYADDVFSAYTYTGNGSTQTITNGIDLAGKGGLVWTKDRASSEHRLQDTVRTPGYSLSTSATLSQTDDSPFFTGFTNSGYSLANGSLTTDYNYASRNYVTWTFRKAPKFFDVVTYTGDGTSNRSIAHSLGNTPGMVIVKCTSASSSWLVWHRSLSPNTEMRLNSTAPAYTPAPVNFSSAPTETNLTTNGDININGASYVAYLFAHDTAADGIVQCGSCTVPGGSGVVAVNLGWEPQYVLFKQSGTSDWLIMDSSRGLAGSQELSSKTLAANSATAESSGQWGSINATGFSTYAWNAGEAIYLAIRRPNKPPTTGTQVYNAIARTGTGAAATVTGVGFAPDLVTVKARTVLSRPFTWVDRLRGSEARLYSDRANAEGSTSSNAAIVLTSAGADYGADSGGEIGEVSNSSASTYINHFFRRAPGFFDVVCYGGNGNSPRPIAHSLGVAPELLIVKERNAAIYGWPVGATAVGWDKYFVGLDSTNVAQPDGSAAWASTPPTSTVFTVGGWDGVNRAGTNYVAYLFASLPGISKVGTYTGNGGGYTSNGSGIVVDCGFSTGARFVLIKNTYRADGQGHWYVFDTARGITAGDDPSLRLNQSTQEDFPAPYDCIDPSASGFIVNQVAATNLNVTGDTYLYLAIA